MKQTFEQLKQKLENKGFSLVLTVPPPATGMYITNIHYFEYHGATTTETLVVEENIFGFSFYQKMTAQNTKFMLQSLEAE